MKKVFSILITLALVLAFSVVAATPMAGSNSPPVTNGLVLHLDADAITGLADGAAVATWVDLSGNGNDASQGTSGYRPLYKTNILNGKPVVRFDGSDDYLATANPVLGSSHTVFVLLKAPNGTQRGGVLAQWSSGTANRYTTIGVHESPTSGTVQANAIKSFLESTGHFGTAGVINTTDWFLIGLRKDGTTDIRHYVGGQLVNTKAGVAQNVQQKALTIGAYGNAVCPFEGDIAEILIYDRALSDGERGQIEQYLGIKWLATCLATATNTGTACFYSSNGTIEDLTAVSVPADSPDGILFPHGMFTFKITGLSSGEEVTLTVELPGPVPIGTKWWKYHNNTWSPMDIGDDDGDNIITVALKDGRSPDDEDTIPGQITDQGGPGYPGAVGWETYAVSKVRVLLPWIALLAAIAAGASSLLVLRRRRAQI